MIPVLTPEQMAEVDRRAPEGFDVLVDRAATKVAVGAIDLMGGTYGRRVCVVAGPGNNGADGRIAATKLRRRGARVGVIEALDLSTLGSRNRFADVDLVIDAAFGTGFRGEFSFPHVGDVPVLAVDIPSGVSGLTGQASGEPTRATATVTFAALKPGLLFGVGAELSGQVRLADIGLDVSGATTHLVEDTDLAIWLPHRRRDSHKWKHAVWVFAGSPGMTGAARLSCSAALRSGAGYVRHSSTSRTQGIEAEGTETVHHRLDDTEWVHALTGDMDRFGAVVVGPGIGLSESTVRAVRQLAALDGFALLIDGDGLNALGDSAVEILAGRRSPTVLTPHDREFERLAGTAPGPDRIASASHLATDTNATVLLKGSTTVVADPDGSVLLSNSGDARLATAGTGDVLSGVIAAHLALGMDPTRAAAAGAFIHGLAATFGPEHGLIASDVVACLPSAYAQILGWSGAPVSYGSAAYSGALV